MSIEPFVQVPSGKRPTAACRLSLARVRIASRVSVRDVALSRLTNIVWVALVIVCESSGGTQARTDRSAMGR